MQLSLGFLAIVVLVSMLSGCASTMLDSAPIGMAKVLEHDAPINNLYRDGKFYFAGQPSEAGFDELAAKGITTVINLRTPEEIEQLEFDEPAHVESLGMTYIAIPITLDSFSDAHVERFAHELANTQGKVLVHCASSNRVGLLWASYLNTYRGIEGHEAFAKGKAAGMTKESYFEAAADRLANH